jgi:hypothetical protein
VNSKITDNTAIKGKNKFSENSEKFPAGTVNTQGGGIYVSFSKSYGILDISNSEITGNIADLAGGLYLGNRGAPAGVQHRIAHSLFKNNTG